MERETDYYVLDVDVVAIAVQGGVGTDWAAYIGSTYDERGVRHPHEEAVKLIRSTGTKLPYEVARILFPRFDEAYTWRP